MVDINVSLKVMEYLLLSSSLKFLGEVEFAKLNGKLELAMGKHASLTKYELVY